MQQMDDRHEQLHARELCKELIRHDVFRGVTPSTLEEELKWMQLAKRCHACGTTQPDCELTWRVDEETVPHCERCEEHDRRVLCRPRRWICVFDVEVCIHKALCPRCYRLIQFELIDGIWDPIFMAPSDLQSILPYKGSQAITSNPLGAR